MKTSFKMMLCVQHRRMKGSMLCEPFEGNFLSSMPRLFLERLTRKVTIQIMLYGALGCILMHTANGTLHDTRGRAPYL